RDRGLPSWSPARVRVGGPPRGAGLRTTAEICLPLNGRRRVLDVCVDRAEIRGTYRVRDGVAMDPAEPARPVDGDHRWWRELAPIHDRVRPSRTDRTGHRLRQRVGRLRHRA